MTPYAKLLLKVIAAIVIAVLAFSLWREYELLADFAAAHPVLFQPDAMKGHAP